jgi:hypothetical protein
MCTNPSKHKLNILYEELVKTDDAIRVWLNIEPKEKWALSYDNDGLRYGNITTNFSKIFNNVLKIVCGLLVSAIMQIIFFKCNNVLWSIEIKLKNFLIVMCCGLQRL